MRVYKCKVSPSSGGGPGSSPSAWHRGGDLEIFSGDPLQARGDLDFPLHQCIGHGGGADLIPDFVSTFFLLCYENFSSFTLCFMVFAGFSYL